jgi:carboxymethylenebutenolidase
MRVQLASGTPAELALPPGPPLRGLVVAPDIMGLRALFDEMCARLASENAWAVCPVEPFPGREHLDMEERKAALAGLDDEVVLGDLLAAADLVAERAGVTRVGVMGFCMGGMYALKAAGTGRFDRAVSFYGMIRVPSEWRGRGQDEPLEYLSRPDACPVLAVVGGLDQFTPSADVEALRAVGGHISIRCYAEAEHGFVHDPARPAHRPDDAADAWRWAVQFLA